MSTKEPKSSITTARLKAKKRKRRFRFSPKKRTISAVSPAVPVELEMEEEEEEEEERVEPANLLEAIPEDSAAKEETHKPTPLVIESNNSHKEFDHLIPDSCRKPGTSLYHCDKCPLKKYNSKTFYIHYSAHKADKRYVCQYCDFSSDRGTALRKHERLHEQNDHLTQLQPTKLYQKHPDETSETNYSAQHHEESEESGEKSGGFHSCSKCPLVSHNVGLFSRHRMRHGGGFARECDECDYSCNTFRGLKQHKLLHQRHNNPINSLKNDLTAEDRELEEKVPKLHLNLRQLQCQQCSFTTNTREALVLHLKKVHKLNQRRLQCHKCDFSSTSRVTLEQHKDVHVGDESLQIHQCHLCNYSALESHQLARHKATAHGSGQDKLNNFVNGSKGGLGDRRRLKRWKPHKMKSCPYCPYRAVNNMGRHVKMHQSSANRLHTCPYCTFSTDVLNALNYHKRLHEDSGGYDSESTEESQLKPTAPTVAACETSIKPTSDCQEFSCQHCPFKTFHGSTFESHVRCHDTSVERAYSCQLCSFRTDLAYHFANHSSVHKKPQTSSSNPIKNGIVNVVNAIKEYSCLKCPYKSTRRSDFMKHLSNHGRNAEFKCAYCDYSVSMRHTLDVHQYFHTRNGKGLSGQLKAVEKKDFDDSNAEIDSYFNDLRILAGDIKLETTSPKITVDTTMIDNSVGQSVKKELKQPSDKKLLFGCKLCGFKSRQWKIIERHKRHHKQQHRGRFTCTKCDFACNRLALIASHKWTHRSVETLYVERRNQRSRHICRLCSLTTGSWVKLKLHKCTSLLHRSGLRNCGHCEFRGKREESVVIHCLTVHGLTVSSALRPANSPINISEGTVQKITLDRDISMGKPSGRKATWKCPHCPYISKYSYDLASHTRMHFGNKQFKCRFCSYNTQRHGALVHHERLHVDQFESSQANIGKPMKNVEKSADLTASAPSKLNSGDQQQRQKGKIVVNKEGIIIGSLLTLNGYRMYSCQFCPYHSTLNSNLVSHSRLHFGDRPYKCPDCNFNTEVQRRLIDHKAVHDSGYVETVSALLPPPSVVSSMSNGRELGKSSLKPYSKQGQMYKCQSCPFAVQSYTALWSHIQKHKQPARYKCDYCSFQTYGTHLMKDHLKLHKAASTTPTERPSRTKRQSNNNNYNSKSTAKVTESLQCTRCDFQAKSFKGLFWHRRVHDRLIVRNLKCKCCSYVAKSHPLLWQHVKKHRMEGGFSCSQCSFKTNLARILEYHQKQHKSKLHEISHMDKKSEFQCKLCPHIAQNHEFLQIHAKMHVGRREFRCTDCNFSASQLKTLENHLQWHNKPLLRRRKEFPVSLDTSSNSSTDMPNNGITSNTSGSYGHKKPNFNCPDCPFKTRIPERLNDHEKYHEDPGKFSCKSCSFSANDQDLVLKHEVLHSHRHTSAVAQRETYKYYCPKCSFQCEFLGNFTKHLHMHGQREGYACSVCDYSCARLRVVKYHEQNHHTHVPFVTLLRSTSAKTVQSSERNSLNTRTAPVSTVKMITSKLKCQFCPFICTNPLDMRTHWGSHSETVVESFQQESQYQKLKYMTELNLIAKEECPA